MQTQIIGFGYKARRGKDTAVKTIIEERGGKFDIRPYSFAGELKREVNEAAANHGGMLGLLSYLRLHSKLPDWVTYEPMPDMTDPLCPLGKQRTLLIWWGTELRRTQDPFYWVKKLGLRLLQERPQFALISDMRFLNEAAFIRAAKGKTVKIERHGYRDDSVISLAGNHPSEHELDGYKGFDYEITVEDGDLAELKLDAVRVFDMIVEGLKVDVTDTEPVTPFVAGEVVVDKPITSRAWKISTPEGARDASQKEVEEFLTLDAGK